MSGRRRTGLLAGSLVLLTASSALFVSAYLKAGHQVPVLAVARAVTPGSVIEGRDLTVVRIAVSGRLAPISSGVVSEVVGRRAAVALVPGTLLTLNEIADSNPVPKGQAVVGVSVKASQLPAEGVAPGEAVEVVLTGIPGSQAFAPPVSSTPTASDAAVTGLQNGSGAADSLSGTVLAPSVLVTTSSPATSANGETTDVSLLVPAAVAPVVASASAAGQVALVAVASPA